MASVMKRWGTWVAHVALLAVWGLLPISVMLIVWRKPELVLRTPSLWGNLAWTWTLVSLILFTILLFASRSGPRSPGDVAQGLMGLACSFVLGLPAIVVSILPLFGSPSDLLHALDPDGCEVALPSPGRLERSRAMQASDKTLYVMAIDLSQSFLRDREDDRYGMVRSAINSLLVPGNPFSLASSLNPEDVVHYYIFASDYRLLGGLSNDVGEAGTEGRRRAGLEMLSSAVEPYLAQERHVDEKGAFDRRSSDIPKFLEGGICTELRDHGKKFDRVKVVMFSDLAFSEDSDPERSRVNLEEVEKCLRPFDEKASLLVFSVPPYEDTEDSADDGRLRYFFESNLPARQWQEIDLQKYDQARFDEKVVVPVSLYAETIDGGTLYLKRRGHPRPLPIPSYLRLPVDEDADTIFLGMSPVSVNSCSLRARFMVQSPRDFILGFGEKDRRYGSLQRLSSEQNPLLIELVEPYGTFSESQCELLVAVPRHSAVYRLQVVVLTVLEEGVLRTFMLLVLILHMFPVVLASSLFWTRCRPFPWGVEKGDSLDRGDPSV